MIIKTQGGINMKQKRPENETNEQRFKRVAEKRTKAILENIRLLGNCSNIRLYSYSPNDVEKIFNTINKNVKKVNLTVESVVEYLLSNNYDVKKALLEYKGVAIDRMKYNSKFDPRIIGSGSYSSSKNPVERTQTYLGEETSSATMYAGITKTFKTGTTI